MNIRSQKLIIGIFGIFIWLSGVPFIGTENNKINDSTVKIYSRILGEERTLTIALPEGYESEKNDYPVLYVLDAEGSKLFSECVSTVVDLYKNGFVPQMIVVGIWNSDRNRDMIPVAVAHRPGSGGSAQFLSFIREELKSYIGQNYRTTDFSTLYGMSNSALFAVYALLESPEMFDAYIASSPMIGHCPDFIQKKAELFVGEDKLNDKILYMIFGTEDSQRVTAYVPEFQKYLKMNAPSSIVSKLEILEGRGHVPDSSLERGLKYVYSQAK